MKKVKPIYYLVIALLIAVIASSIFVIFLWQRDQVERELHQGKLLGLIGQMPELCEQTHRLDGMCYEGEVEPAVFSVMIENHVDSRPASGLAEASLVYESIVEAPITRFLAVYREDQIVDEIGPVRSARPFYVDWAKEFGGPYVHVGGSNEALDILARSYTFDLNEFSNGHYFWRKWTRPQPHNVFTSTENISKAIESKGWDVKTAFPSWQFQPQSLVEDRGELTKVIVDFATYNFLVEWNYDIETNDFIRYQAGKAHVDRDGKQITAKNIVVMYTESTVIDSYGRRKTRTTGKGDALIFQEGKVIEGSWQRAGLSERTKFYDENMNEVSFLVGKTWIEVVPTHFPKVKYE